MERSHPATGGIFLFRRFLFSRKSAVVIDNSYTLATGEDFMSFEFDSIGPKGVVRKIIKYDKIGNTDYYNLGFGDKYPDTNDFDDLTITNNGDGRKVLITVAQTAVDFTRMYPNALVVAAGSTPSRTRLYRILIANNLPTIEQYFEIFGLLNSAWEPFVKDIDYPAFLITRKRFNFKL